MMRSVLAYKERSKAEQTSHVFQGHFLALVPSRLLFRLPALWHLFLVGILVLAVVFWVCLGCWIIVRLVLTAKK
jgi:hypothetical protein